jgi:hypothetical protein
MKISNFDRASKARSQVRFDRPSELIRINEKWNREKYDDQNAKNNAADLQSFHRVSLPSPQRLGQTASSHNTRKFKPLTAVGRPTRFIIQGRSEVKGPLPPAQAFSKVLAPVLFYLRDENPARPSKVNTLDSLRSKPLSSSYLAIFVGLAWLLQSTQQARRRIPYV